MNIVATGVPATLEDYQVALNAVFEGGKAMGKAMAEQQAEHTYGANWSVFNTGACVADGLTTEEAKEYMTPERIARGWTAVYCVVVKADDEWPTAKQEQGESVVSYERFMGVEKELADMTAEFMRVAKELAESKQEQGEPVGFVVDRYNGANTPASPPTPIVAWLNDNPKIGQILYTTPQQRKPLTDEDIEIIDDSMCGHREFAVPFARAVLKAAHGSKVEA
jgi:hypothetical protein